MTRNLVAISLAAILSACASMGGTPMAAKIEAGMLVDAKGMTLYTFDKDMSGSGKSVCNGGCAKNWPPLMVEGADHASGDWSVITRDDGAKQWAYKGKPLYLWVKDHKPGEKTGDGVNKVWHVAVQ